MYVVPTLFMHTHTLTQNGLNLRWALELSNIASLKWCAYQGQCFIHCLKAPGLALSSLENPNRCWLHKGHGDDECEWGLSCPGAPVGPAAVSEPGSNPQRSREGSESTGIIRPSRPVDSPPRGAIHTPGGLVSFPYVGWTALVFSLAAGALTNPHLLESSVLYMS